MDAKEMEQLLREGAYAVLLEGDDEVKEFFQQVRPSVRRLGIDKTLY